MYTRNILLCTTLLMTQFSYAQEKNIALHKPVVTTSELPGSPASNMVDGKISRTSRWEAGNAKAPHIVEIDLKKYYNVTSIKVHSGIMDAEKKPDEMVQAAGFWSVKNFRLQYWDDANWSDFPKSEVHENRLTTAAFNFNPPITTFKIRLICDDGEPINIMEIEAFGSETPNMPEPPTINTGFKPQTVASGPQTATISISNTIVGKSMKYVGYNQGYYMPKSNVSGWVEYSNVNSFRVWASLNAFVPEKTVQVDPAVNSIAIFDQRKAAIRANPENNAFIQWNKLTPLYDLPDSSSTNAMVFNYALTELKRLRIDVILQIGSTDFEDNWSNKWKQWQRYYALAYYAAKKGDVSMFAMQNEPNHRNSGPMKLDQWIMGMQIVSDAINAAVEDVNKKYGKKLQPAFVGPVTAGNNPEWWTAIAKAIRTDYHGKTIDKDLIGVFSTHSYNSPAVGYETRIDNIQKIIRENHPAGHSLPIAYTEIGRWMNAYLIDKDETMDSPSLFTEWAGIYSNNMKNGGYGMWAFKFANTSSGPYPLGIKSGHHYIWQGRRIVEDAYVNLAQNKKVSTNASGNAALVTDGNKSDLSAWVADSTITQKWVEIDLGRTTELGSAVVYTGSASGVYTAPDRVRNFSLQYATTNGWMDIPGTVVKDNKYAQVFFVFRSPIATDKVRFLTEDKGSPRVREIKLFGKGDGPSKRPDYNVSGIQRTGEVVRLFAKGFRNERPLYKTTASIEDNGLDHYTSYDSLTGNYYMWLVQRGMFDYTLQLDLAALNIAAGTAITAETVGPASYGEVSTIATVSADQHATISVPSQSVVLLTIPASKSSMLTIPATASAMVTGDGIRSPSLQVQLDAASPVRNKVVYLQFDLSTIQTKTVERVLLKVKGYTNKENNPFRLHVYGFSNTPWKSATITWSNAPWLDHREALVEGVGEKTFVAGELAFTKANNDHLLDVTELVKKHAGKSISFIVVRETRQLGDDEDSGYQVTLEPASSLLIWKK